MFQVKEILKKLAVLDGQCDMYFTELSLLVKVVICFAFERSETLPGMLWYNLIQVLSDYEKLSTSGSWTEVYYSYIP